jgi:hypothetical protein
MEASIRMQTLATLPIAVAFLAFSPTSAQTAGFGARPQTDFVFQERADGSILAADAQGTHVFPDWRAYVLSPFFQDHGARCGTSKLALPLALMPTSDCSSTNTNPAAQYHPSNGVEYVIPVVFHIIRRSNGVTGEVSNALINTQIDVMNEDFLAYGAGAPGTNTRIRFFLAGVTRSNNNTWYDDGGSYYNTLAWDPLHYLNIYTNTASGNLGYAYVPSGGGVVGNLFDRVVIYWPTVGRPGPYGSPYDLGRTVTHEVGHYFGLYHPFDGGCSGLANCYQNGDKICDTLPEQSPNFSPCTRSTCGDPDPTHNYMDYSDDVCMDQFTLDQTHRMRCTLANFRVALPLVPPGLAQAPSPTNGASGVLVSANLSWTAGAGATAHDVYFGTNPAPGAGEFQGNQAGTTFAPGTLAYATTYYWRIDEENEAGTTTGSVWSFTTEGPPPPPQPASGPRPRDLAAQTGRRATLSWIAGAGATSHDVYFGTVDPPPFIGNQGGTSFDPGFLDRNVTYYWRIDEVNAQGTTSGSVWSFTTGRNVAPRSF